MVQGKGPGAPTKPRQSAKKKAAETNGEQKPKTAAESAPPRETTVKPKRQAPPPPTELNEEQKQALFHDHLRNYRNQLELLEAARIAHDQRKSALRNFLKLAKAEGTTEADLKFILRIEEEGGEERFKKEVERHMQLARWGAHKIGYQPSMFGDDRTPAVDQARAEGRVACLRGDIRKPPHDPSVPQYDAWMEGYAEGQQTLMKGFRKAEGPSPDGTPVGSQPAEANGAPTTAEVADAVADGLSDAVEGAQEAVGEPAITSGQFVSRADFHRQLKDNEEAAKKLAAPPPVGDQPSTYTVA